MFADYVEIGKIVNTFGLKGELKVQSDSDFIAYRFRKDATIFLHIGRALKEFKVSSMREVKGCVMITINELYDINQVEQYVGASVYALKSDKPVLEQDHYMMDDLIGLPVYNEKNVLLGTLNDFICIPANNIMEIVSDTDEKKLVPFVKDLLVEVAKDKIVIKDLEVVGGDEI